MAVDDPLALTPPAAVLLGRRVLSADRERGIVELGFTATEQFCNRLGNVQGGLLAAMLDSALGCAAVAVLPPPASVVTLSMSVSFLAPAAPGALRGTGRVRRSGRSVIFAEAELRDAADEVVATASATMRVVGAPRTG
ncbi:MAG: PaaI family thioesterase [bacterium]